MNVKILRKLWDWTFLVGLLVWSILLFKQVIFPEHLPTTLPEYRGAIAFTVFASGFLFFVMLMAYFEWEEWRTKTQIDRARLGQTQKGFCYRGSFVWNQKGQDVIDQIMEHTRDTEVSEVISLALKVCSLVVEEYEHGRDVLEVAMARRHMEAAVKEKPQIQLVVDNTKK